MKSHAQIKTSVFDLSVQHLAFITFTLLAVLPSLAIIRIGVLIFTRNSLAPLQGLETSALGIFAVLCYGAGFYCLHAIVKRIKLLHRESFRIGGESGILEPIETLSGDILATAAGARESATRNTGAFGNELESLSSTLTQIQSQLTRNLTRLQDQAFFLNRLETLLDDSEDVAVITDAENNVLFSNRAARNVLGIYPDSPLRYALQEGHLAADDLDRSIAILESWEDHAEEIRFRKDDGSILTFEVKFRITQGQHGEPSKILVMRDISARKRLERQLYRSEKLATLGQLISGVAHELNNPLAAILGFAELSRDSGQTKQELDSNLEIIEREARRTGHIVENLLNFSRQRQSQRTVVDVHELLERCFNLLAYNFRTTGIVIRRDYDASLPSLKLDEYQMQQVFMNIIVNSAQAMKNADTEAPRITVRTHLTKDEKQLVIEIEDNGPGIPPENRKSVFEPFFTTKQEDEGTGLGLPVSLSILKSHGGTILLSRSRGRESGAGFRIVLPLPKSAVAPSPKTRKTTVRRDLTGRVLVVDDEPSMLKMTQAALQRTGLDVISASTVKEALAELVRHDFDMALVDVYLPDGSGMDIWDFVQSHHPQLVGRVVFITGEPQIRRKIETRLGVDPKILLKPFHVNDLYDVVKDQIGDRITELSST